MKKIAIIASIIAAAFVVTSCATKGTSDNMSTASSAQTGTAKHHHDYKGEMK